MARPAAGGRRLRVRAGARLQRLSYRRGRRGALAGGERLSLSHGRTAFRAPTPAGHISGGRPLKTAPKTAADTPARGAVGARERRPAPSVTATQCPGASAGEPPVNAVDVPRAERGSERVPIRRGQNRGPSKRRLARHTHPE